MVCDRNLFTSVDKHTDIYVNVMSNLRTCLFHETDTILYQGGIIFMTVNRSLCQQDYATNTVVGSSLKMRWALVQLRFH